MLVLTRALGSLMLVAMGILVARWAGPTDFGLLSTIISVGAVLFVVSDFGMSTYISRAVAQHDTVGVGAALRINTLTTVGGGFLATLMVFVYVGLEGSYSGLAMMGIALALEKNTDTALSIPIASGDKTTPAQSLILRRAVGLLALGGFHQIAFSPLDAYSLAFFLGSLVGQIHMRIRLKRWYVSGHKNSGMLRKAFPFLVSNVSASARNLDTAIVSAAVSSQAGGIYAGAQRLMSPFMLIPGVIASLVLPHATRGSAGRALSILQKLVITHLVILLILGCVIPFAEKIIVLVLGQEYAPSSEVFVWLLLAFPFIALSSPMGGVLQSQGYEKQVASNGLWFGLALVPALWVGALYAGPVGCAICLLGVYVLKCTSLYAIAKSRLS